MNKTAFITYLLALLLFGSNGVAASAVDLSSQEIVLLRTMIGSGLLIVLFFLSGGRISFHRHGRALMRLAVSGAAMGLSWMLLYEAYDRIGVGVASLLYYCGPVLVMMLSPLVFRERLTAAKLTGFLAVLAGVVLVNGDALGGGGDRLGVLCGLGSAGMYAVMVIFNKKAGKIQGLENAALQLLISFLTVAVLVGLRQGYAISVPRESLVPLLMLGLVNTGVGCFLYFTAIGRLPVQTVAVCGYLEPLSAVVFSAVLLGERMLPVQALGAALILGGAAFGELAGQQKKTSLK